MFEAWFFFLCRQQKLQTRGGRILALVPVENAPSDDSALSDAEEEFRVRTPLSVSTSSAPSIDSSLERLLDDDGNSSSENVPLTPIFQTVYSSPSLEPNCNKVPVLSDIPSLPATPATPADPPTPAPPLPTTSNSATPRFAAQVTSSTLRFTRNTRSQRRPTVSVPKRPRRITKFRLSYQWRKASFRLRTTIEQDSNHTDVPDLSSLDYFYKFFSPDILQDIVE